MEVAGHMKIFILIASILLTWSVVWAGDNWVYVVSDSEGYKWYLGEHEKRKGATNETSLAFQRKRSRGLNGESHNERDG